ncbi:Mce family protein [Nocardia farcinica]|uniref:Mce family protein n=1 Tax=Nocardia farcinica TaxID=37329 RepID=A0A0H5NIE3_NOCFR|nr:Mce family protein [Nocardia farcinica]AXK84586.1 Mce family protein [Nocardia farcinica]MBF6418107.1 Mce family protein [Nocardia farcinica]MBF6429584.1 Mce family protein [Nocardia farcinica]MBF6500168.1 Mce family protein [Nocardia farcinica]MCZ9325731.1 Mce family protein [Nocardia farcinica]
MSRASMFSERGPGRTGLRLRGLVLLAALILLTGAVWRSVPPDRAGQAGFDLVAATLGDGVGVDTPVRLRGRTVGAVVAVAPLGVDRRRVSIGIEAPRLAELSTAMQTRFVSANLFGSTALELVPMPGGQPLSEGMVLDVGDRVDNFTVTGILRESGRAVTEVLTPRLAAALEDAADLTEAGAPLLGAALLVARTWQRVERVPLAQALPAVADATEGAAAFTPSALGILTALASVEELDDDVHIGQASDTISEVSNLVFAFAGQLVGALGPTSDAVDMLLDTLIPLNQAVRGVTPAQVGALTDRLDGALHGDGDGVVLDVEVLIAAMPAFALPLAATAGAHR